MLHNSSNEEDYGSCCYLCNECPNTFTTLSQLQTHLVNDHKANGTSPTLFAVKQNENKNEFINLCPIPTIISKNVSQKSNIESTLTGANFSSVQPFLSKSELHNILTIMPTCIDATAIIGDANADEECETNEEVMHSPTSSEFSTEEISADNNKFFTYSNEINIVDKLEDEIVQKVQTSNGYTAGYPCMKCPRVFAERDQLNIHYTHTHREKPQYVCDVCSRIFLVKRELSTHLRIHSGEQPHKCAQCSKEFGTRQLLKKHNMWHTGERSHVCPHCSKAFFQKGHLTQHLMIHKGGRPHQCPLCEKTFIFKFDLNRHMKIHAERGHSCSKCGKCFPKQCTLDEHYAKCKRRLYLKNNSFLAENPTPKRQRFQSPGSKFLKLKCRENNLFSTLPTSNLLAIDKMSPFVSSKIPSGEQKCFGKKESKMSIKITDENPLFINNDNNKQEVLNSRLITMHNWTNLLAAATETAIENGKLQQNSFAPLPGNFAQFPFKLAQQPNLKLTGTGVQPSLFFNLPLHTRNDANDHFQKSDPQNELPLSSTHPSQQQQNSSPLYYCFLCSKHLHNQAAYMLHWSLVHFKNNIFSRNPDSLLQNPTIESSNTFIVNEVKEVNINHQLNAKHDKFNSTPFMNSTLLKEFLKQNNNSDEIRCADSATSSSSSAFSPQKKSLIANTQQHLPNLNSLTNEQSDGNNQHLSTYSEISIPVNDDSPLISECLPQLSAASSFSPVSILGMPLCSMSSVYSMNPTLETHSLLSMPIRTKESDEMVCNNSLGSFKHHCKHCNISEEKQLTLKKQLTDVQLELFKMREVMQRVGIITNALFDGEKTNTATPKELQVQSLKTKENSLQQQELTLPLPPCNGKVLEKLWVLLSAK